MEITHILLANGAYPWSTAITDLKTVLDSNEKAKNLLTKVRRVKSILIIFFKITSSCSTRCDYEDFSRTYNKKFSNRVTKGSDIIYEELIFTPKHYIHNTIVNDVIVSDTGNYNYNKENGKITTINFITRYDRVNGDYFIYSPSTTVFQFRCSEISLGDIYYIIE